MPLIEVTHRADVPDAVLLALARELPHLVSLAVACCGEPYEPPLGPGDVELRFHPLGRFDISGVDLVIEVRSKFFDDRATDRQRRADQLLDAVAPLVGKRSVGVYLTMPVASWAQR